MAKKGEQKTGGRSKGTPNRKTKELQAIADRLDVSPFEVLCLFAKGDWKTLGYKSEKYVCGLNQYGEWKKHTIDPSVRAKAAGEACEYLFPKRKAIEHSVDDPLRETLDKMSDTELEKKIDLYLAEYLKGKSVAKT